jgi:hypothetical protein
MWGETPATCFVLLWERSRIRSDKERKGRGKGGRGLLFLKVTAGAFFPFNFFLEKTPFQQRVMSRK